MTAVCIAKRHGSTPVTARFSVMDAKRAGLWTKAGPWQTYPRRMLQMRARRGLVPSSACRRCTMWPFSKLWRLGLPSLAPHFCQLLGRIMGMYLQVPLQTVSGRSGPWATKNIWPRMD